jgi:hypothetical protein
MPRLPDAALWDKMQQLGQNPSGPRPLPPRKRDNEESRSQTDLIVWWHTAHKDFGIPEMLLYSIPNGGWRDPVGAKILKREGQRNGVSDLFLAVPRCEYHGLYVEMKAAKGVVSKEQEEFLKHVTAQGYEAKVCRSYDEAVKEIEGYLGE